MTDRPIIFSAPMVRALIEGCKTQTRRLLKHKSINVGISTHVEVDHPIWIQFCHPKGGPLTCVKWPYAIGDRLWVREAWAHYQTVNHVHRSDGRAFDEVSDGLAGYRADGHETIEDFRSHVRLMSGCDLEQVVINGDRWRSPIHMPRWASRLTLIVKDVRVQRLQYITEADAVAEGIYRTDPTPEDIAAGCTADNFVFQAPGVRQGLGPKEQRENDQWWPTASGAFRLLWNSIHGPDAWDANPWVAAISFDVKRGNIDEVGK